MMSKIRLLTLLSCCVAGSGHAQLLEQTQLPVVKDVLRLPASTPLVDKLDNDLPKLREVTEQLPLKRVLKTLDGGVLLTEVKTREGIWFAEREWLLLASQKAEQLLTAAGVTDWQRRRFGALGIELLHVTVPEGLDNRKALKQLLGDYVVDRNHLFTPQQDAGTHQIGPVAGDAITQCQHSVRLGVIDTDYDADNPWLMAGRVERRTFIRPGLQAARHHGSAVLGRLISTHPQFKGRLKDAQVALAAVFYQSDSVVERATALDLVAALDWLASEDVKVVNMSLTGPDNRLLALAVEQFIAKDRYIVAASGNHGPASLPRFPAGYPGVVTVTAVDQHQQIYRWANQGDFVDFAAQGVNVYTTVGQGVRPESGTSLAAPLVSAALVCALAKGEPDPLKLLQNNAQDLGQPGRDPVFGYGLLMMTSELGFQ